MRRRDDSPRFGELQMTVFVIYIVLAEAPTLAGMGRAAANHCDFISAMMRAARDTTCCMRCDTQALCTIGAMPVPFLRRGSNDTGFRGGRASSNAPMAQ
jgi:hypothetical protein